MACMGDRLTLAGFAMAVPIWRHLRAAVTTAEEALAAVSLHKPDLFFVSEDLEQGYGISLVREVERLHAATRTLIFLRRENPAVVNEALEAGADGVMFVSSIGRERGDFSRRFNAPVTVPFTTRSGFGTWCAAAPLKIQP